MKKLVLVLVGFLMAGNLIAQSKKEPIILISTTYGDIRIKLFKETPLHTKNFVKLAKQGYFGELLFHRVIKDFMIQGGDPDSKKAQPGQLLGNGGPDYTIPFEYVPAYFHQKGMVAAAREGDEENPLRVSSASQFYIVVGKVFDDADLDVAEKRINTMHKANLMYSYIASNKTLKDRLAENKKSDTAAYNRQMKQLDILADSLYKEQKPYVIPAQEREIYKTIGGVPRLDASYSIFGEVMEGLDVVEKISKAATDKNDRPIENIVMKVRVLKGKELKRHNTLIDKP